MNKTPLDPSLPKLAKAIFEGNEVDCEIWAVREFGGIQDYILFRAPYSREFTRISMVKGSLHPIKDDYQNQPKWLRGQFK